MMATLKTASLVQCARLPSRRSASARSGAKAAAVSRPRVRTSTLVRCATEDASPGSSCKVARREVLSLAAAAAVMKIAPPVFADEEGEPITFYGAANPPATYGGIGGTAPEMARYTFQYPAGMFKELGVSKIEKGTNGTDTKFVSTARSKKEQVYVVSLANEGAVGGFKQQDPERLLSSVSGSDYVFQDALNLGEVTSSKRTVDDDTFYDFVIEGADTFLVSITTRQGRLFAIFVNAPLKSYKDDKAMLETIQKSFRTLEVDVLF
mmetsp:Transcript_12364/g.25981  ORF Transcript_12364/g.25981 Transcript_12364/m.25981 type:complete len:265 (-) Transcript_12364:127-921(-)